jgi:long-chain acyl-CoA synthetase
VYPGPHARERADQAAFIMASTGESVSYAEYEARTNRLAHLLRARGLGRLDHYAIFMENNDRYLEACGAGERAGLYYTCVNSYLTAPELAYILNNSTSKLLITSRACREVALEAVRDCPGLTSGLIVDGTGDDGIFADFEEATRRPRPRSTWPSGTAGPWSSWRNSTLSSTCAWSSGTG